MLMTILILPPISVFLIGTDPEKPIRAKYRSCGIASFSIEITVLDEMNNFVLMNSDKFIAKLTLVGPLAHRQVTCRRNNEIKQITHRKTQRTALKEGALRPGINGKLKIFGNLGILECCNLCSLPQPCKRMSSLWRPSQAFGFIIPNCGKVSVCSRHLHCQVFPIWMPIKETVRLFLFKCFKSSKIDHVTQALYFCM